MKKMILFSAIILFNSCIESNKKPDLAFENKMLIYQNGYIRGRINEMTCVTLEDSQIKWKKDSTEFRKLMTH